MFPVPILFVIASFIRIESNNTNGTRMENSLECIISHMNEQNPLEISVDDIDDYLRMNDSEFIEFIENLTPHEEMNNEMNRLESEIKLQKRFKNYNDPLFSSENNEMIVIDSSSENEFDDSSNVPNPKKTTDTDEQNPITIVIDDNDEFPSLKERGFKKSDHGETSNQLYASKSKTNFQKNSKDDSDPVFSSENKDITVIDSSSESEVDDTSKVSNQKAGNTRLKLKDKTDIEDLKASESPHINEINMISNTGKQNTLGLTIEDFDEFLSTNDLDSIDFNPEEMMNEFYASQSKTNRPKSFKEDSDPLLSSKNQEIMVIDSSSENEPEQYSRVRNQKVRKRKLSGNHNYQTKKTRSSQNRQTQDRFKIGGISNDPGEEKIIIIEDYNPDEIFVVPDSPEHYDSHLKNKTTKEKSVKKQDF